MSQFKNIGTLVDENYASRVGEAFCLLAEQQKRAGIIARILKENGFPAIPKTTGELVFCGHTYSPEEVAEAIGDTEAQGPLLLVRRAWSLHLDQQEAI